MSSVSGTQSEEVKTHIECDHCGFSVASVSPSLNRCPRCWRPIQVPSSENPPHKQTSLVFAEATSAESEEPDHLLLILGIDEDDEPESSKSRMKRWLAGYGVSFFVHGIILLSAALIVYQVQKFNWHDSIQSSVSEGLGGLGSAGGLEPMQPIEFQVKREVQELSFDNPAYQSATVLNFGEGGDSQGVGDGGIGFFGTKSKGNSFVFVVDISGSMQANFLDPDPENPGTLRVITRWDKARDELLSAINAMTEEQTYCVVLYNDRHRPMMEQGRVVGLRSASLNNRQKTKRWLQTIGAIGGTDPTESLAFGLDLRPDVLYFLTDGAIPELSREVCEIANHGQTVIHTTCIGYPLNDLLQMIAADHKGQFRAITPDGDLGAPEGISLILLVRSESGQRQKMIHMQKGHEQLLEAIGDPAIRFQTPNTHSTLFLHNAVSSPTEFNTELLKLLRVLNTEGSLRMTNQVRSGILGVGVSLDSDRPLTDVTTIEDHRALQITVKTLLDSIVSPDDFESFPQNIKTIYLFGDLQSKREIESSLEVFDLYNGSQMDIIDGDDFLRKNR